MYIYTKWLICEYNNYDNIHYMPYRIEIMLRGIAIINTGYSDNTNDYY